MMRNEMIAKSAFGSQAHRLVAQISEKRATRIQQITIKATQLSVQVECMQ
jgi:hypothetical protein